MMKQNALGGVVSSLNRPKHSRVTRITERAWIFAISVGCAVLLLQSVEAAPYASVTMDARDGRITHSQNAHQRLHPASLTKMMTLYIAFEAIESGEISVNQKVTISKHAASEPASKIYLRQGSRVLVRNLVRAAAIRSANDAATALAEAISGSEAEFAKRMTRTARAMGMNNTSFKNAHGLTQVGHYSTAYDMTLLGRRMIYDYSDYYNLFSRRSTNIGSSTIYNTNRRFLNSFSGADGIKTGFTRAAGYNLVASARRNDVRLVVTVFGASSVPDRNSRVSKLLENGFNVAPGYVRLSRPILPLNSNSNGTIKAVLALGLPLKRPSELENSESPRVVATIVAHLERSNQERLELEVGDAVEGPITAENFLSRPKPRPRSLSALAAFDDLSLNAGVNLGKFATKSKLDLHATRVQLIDTRSLFSARKVVQSDKSGYHLRFIGLSAADASRACKKIEHRGHSCSVIYLR